MEKECGFWFSGFPVTTPQSAASVVAPISAQRCDVHNEPMSASIILPTWKSAFFSHLQSLSRGLRRAKGVFLYDFEGKVSSTS